MLLDSNVIVFAARPEHGDLRAFIAQHSPAVSAVSYVEVLGYHKHSESQRALFESFFAAANVLPLSDAVLREAILLRQQRQMSLGDSLIAGTALTHGLKLVTGNTADFRWIPGLTLIDPFATP